MFEDQQCTSHKITKWVPQRVVLRKDRHSVCELFLSIHWGVCALHQVTKLKRCLLVNWFLSLLDKATGNPNMSVHKVLLEHSHAH